MTEPDATPQMCLECGAENPGAAQVCTRCGAPVAHQPPVAAGTAGAARGSIPLPDELASRLNRPGVQRDALILTGFGIRRAGGGDHPGGIGNHDHHEIGLVKAIRVIDTIGAIEVVRGIWLCEGIGLTGAVGEPADLRAGSARRLRAGPEHNHHQQLSRRVHGRALLSAAHWGSIFLGRYLAAIFGLPWR